MGAYNVGHNGGCHCGAVQFVVTGDPVWKTLCYCESCRRSAGAPVVAWATFTRSCFQISKGEITHYRSSRGVIRGFCRDCGTTLTYEPNPVAGTQSSRDTSLDISVAVMSFRNPDNFTPEDRVLFAERVSWWADSATLPDHEVLTGETCCLSTIEPHGL